MAQVVASDCGNFSVKNLAMHLASMFNLLIIVASVSARILK